MKSRPRSPCRDLAGTKIRRHQGDLAAEDRRLSIWRSPERRATVRGRQAPGERASAQVPRNTRLFEELAHRSGAPIGFFHRTSMPEVAPQRHRSSLMFDVPRRLRRPSRSSQRPFGTLSRGSIFAAANSLDVWSWRLAPTGCQRRRRTRAGSLWLTLIHDHRLTRLTAIPAAGLNRTPACARLGRSSECGNAATVPRPTSCGRSRRSQGDRRPSRQHSLPEPPCGELV